MLSQVLVHYGHQLQHLDDEVCQFLLGMLKLWGCFAESYMFLQLHSLLQWQQLLLADLSLGVLLQK